MRRIILPIVALLFPIHVHAQNGLKAPPGFEVVEFANEKLANDIHVMTVDPKGRVIVAGRGYIRILVDDDGDGKADRALPFADTPKDGAMGLLWEEGTLYVTGDGGLRAFTSKTGDKADGPSKLLRAIKTGGEHTSHAIRRGPDGWLYVLCGNNAGIDKSYAELPTSPVRDPIAGCVLRFHPQTWKCEIVAHGFRNPYGMDFNLEGDLFTYDSDNERCVSLPWYEPTRFYHVIEGRHYGWLNPQHAVTWRRPPYFCDVVAPIAYLGRGSPTGVACYRHNQFPPEYHGGFFLADWTFGKIHFASLERKGASYTAKPRVFLESQGENGFAPTACAVDAKTGDLYVSIGGRGTRGAVYRVRHTERFKAMQGKLAPLKMAKRSLEWAPGLEKKLYYGLFSKDPERLLTAQLIRRHVATEPAAAPFFKDAILTNWQHPDMHLRRAAADLVDELSRGRLPKIENPISGHPNAAMRVTVALGAAGNRKTLLEHGLFNLRYSTRLDERLPGIRFVQLALGDIGDRKSIGTLWEAYTARLPVDDKETGPILAKYFPSKYADLDYELARTLGMLGSDDLGVRARLLARCGPDSGPLDGIHYLACYARMGGERFDQEAKLVASALLDLDRKIAARKLNRDSNWAPRVRELYVGLAEKDAALHQAMLDHPDFGRADHALFANTDGFPKDKAARVFLGGWQRDKNFTLNGNIVALFETLPTDDVLPTIRKRWTQTGHEAALLPILAKKPIAEDRKRFIDGLNSPLATTLIACIDGLNKLDMKSDAEEGVALIRALHRASGTPKPAPYAARLAGRLEKLTGQTFGGDSKRWIAWFESLNPEEGKRLANPDGVDVAKWDARLAKLDWTAGDATAGKAAYAKANCVQCHSGSQALGPDLVGVANRFSRADLFTAILQPSRDVPARYQTTMVETKAGKTHQGIVIYDAVDSLILQTGAATTVRLDGAEVAHRYVSSQSLMPAGLLDALTDREIVDLYAYMRGMGK
jgi:putative membrane-bound dehydrogenase-like protein